MPKARFHVNSKGEAGKCSATVGACPFGGESGDENHFDTLAAAQVESERRLTEEHNPLASLKKAEPATINTPDLDYAGAEPKARTEEMVKDLEDAIGKIVADGNLAKYLDAMAANGKNRWTFSNVVLAAYQLKSWQKRNGINTDDAEGNGLKGILKTISNMDACGAKQWGARGRKVTSGKGSALYILAPLMAKRELKDKNGKPVIGKDGKPIKSMTPYGFRSVAVFDVSQTEGEPVPENPINVTPVDKEIDEKYIDSMRDWITKAGYTYEEEETATDPEKLTGVLGYTSHTQKKVAVDPRLSAAQRAATTAHELAHIHMGHVTAEGAEDYRFHRGRMETEAEGLAYLIMRRAGLNAQEAESFSPGYIAGWSKGDASVVKKAMNSVSTKFNNLMDELKW